MSTPSPHGVASFLFFLISNDCVAATTHGDLRC